MARMNNKAKKTNKDKSIFAQRLSQARKAMGLNQWDFAEDLGMHHNTIVFYENDIRRPNIDTLVRIAKFLNVSTDWLLGMKE